MSMNDFRQRIRGIWLVVVAVMAMAFLMTTTTLASAAVGEVPARRLLLKVPPMSAVGQADDALKRFTVNFGTAESRGESSQPTVMASIVWGSFASTTRAAADRGPAAFPAIDYGGGGRESSAANVSIPNR
jgi:hypothetical protein